MSKCDYCNNESRVRLTDENGTVHELCHECHNQKMADLLEIDNFKDFTRKYRTTDIDGKSYTWSHVGKVLMACEGFNLHMDIIEEGLDE